MNRPPVPSTEQASSGGPTRGRTGAGRLALITSLMLVVTLHGLALAALVHPAWLGRPGNAQGPGALRLQARVQALSLAAPGGEPGAATAPSSDRSTALANTAAADTAPASTAEPPPRPQRPTTEPATGSSTGTAPTLGALTPGNANPHAPAIDAIPATQAARSAQFTAPPAWPDGTDAARRLDDAGAPDPAGAPYLPRSALSQPARPLADVQINDPGDAPAGDYQATLLLYIDETGRVQHVRLRDGALPPSLHSAAQAGFAAVRFLPGQVQGRPVRSLYPVAVSFSASARAVRNAGVR